jgi:hypothetical protein
MPYQVSGAPNGAIINFAPANVVEEVLQNVRTLIMTIKYSAVLDRELGIDATFLDRPTPDAMARLRVQIAEEIRRSEPRALVKIIEFKKHEDEAMEGTYYSLLHVDVLGG